MLLSVDTTYCGGAEIQYSSASGYCICILRGSISRYCTALGNVSEADFEIWLHESHSLWGFAVHCCLKYLAVQYWINNTTRQSASYIHNSNSDNNNNNNNSDNNRTATITTATTIITSIVAAAAIKITTTTTLTIATITTTATTISSEYQQT